MKNYKIDKVNKKIVCHDFINGIMRINNCPHEWYFLNILLEEIKSNKDLASTFVLFVLQFYPDYLWTALPGFDCLTAVLIEISLHDLRFKYVFNGLEPKQNLNKAMEFGNIVTDFLIRFCNYSLIKSCGQKVILTSRNDCDKYFLPYLLDDYSLFRYSKISCLDSLTFYKRPVFPTRELYNGSEFIESSNGDFVSIPNYNRTRKCK